MTDMIVNWVKEDEELLEPYEWQQGDDIEIISTIQCIRVDEKTLHDFIYGCLLLFDRQYFNKVFAVGNGKLAVAVETNHQGKLCYRSVFDFASRKQINEQILKQPVLAIQYQMYDEGELKEYGLTRKERLKKQYIDHKIDELYMEDYDMFVLLCQQLNIQEEKSIAKYEHLKKLISNGYSFVHELLYNELIKKEYKKK
ncbi:hypothetical protein H6A03_09015 [[Clostridium] spiroforme]|nr:hypothetical protein [Thomasclavelia spiroformis]MBM6881167.1 hypothetical protein [Thomasclavelia spiroformis]MBM6931660.1 hypothetical protein [Thomasclavelia spiroformis]